MTPLDGFMFCLGAFPFIALCALLQMFVESKKTATQAVGVYGALALLVWGLLEIF